MPPKPERNLQDAKSTTESASGEESIGITYAAESEARQLRIEEDGSLFFLTGIARDYNKRSGGILQVGGAAGYGSLFKHSAQASDGA